MPISVRPISKDFAESLMEQVTRRTVGGNDGCVELSGSPDSHGYSRVWIWVNGKAIMYRAHRVVWAFHKGDIGPGALILHKCDNRRCVKLNHLFRGTPKDNTHDSMRKDRFGFGERHGCAKITVDDVLAIRRKRKDGMTFTAIGAEHGISSSHACGVANGKSWKTLRRCVEGRT